jgi:hypothetical protein
MASKDDPTNKTLMKLKKSNAAKKRIDKNTIETPILTLAAVRPSGGTVETPLDENRRLVREASKAPNDLNSRLRALMSAETMDYEAIRKILGTIPATAAVPPQRPQATNPSTSTVVIGIDHHAMKEAQLAFEKQRSTEAEQFLQLPPTEAKERRTFDKPSWADLHVSLRTSFPRGRALVHSTRHC